MTLVCDKNERSADMPRYISTPTVVESVGNLPKRIEEYVGRVNSGDSSASVARMVSPSGWEEPGQKPLFDEMTLVLKGALKVESEEGSFDVSAGQAIIVKAGEWVRYSSPGAEGAEYVAICIPAFSPETVQRDDAQDG